MNKILQDLNVYKSSKGNQDLVKLLTKTPPKEPRNIAPTTYTPKPNVADQADLLYLPSDHGYKYLLVVVDLYNRKVDAEPLKNKTSALTYKALDKIYKRDIIGRPLRLEVDPGKEFKGEFYEHFHKILDIVYKVAGRHRQQSVVETKNYQIGKILNAKMLNEEINNNKTSRSWIKSIKEVIRLMNLYLSHEPTEITVDTPVKTNKFTSDLLPNGTKVRIQLDNPESYVDGKKLHGKFRAGDIRYSKEIHTITQLYLRPGQPPMYQVDNNRKVAYTKYQLQVINDISTKS
jgi:hypothetical protein